MDFLEAVKAKRAGKRPTYGIHELILFEGRYMVLDSCEQYQQLTTEHIDTTDWEVVEDKETLSDKIYGGNELHLSDVKEAIKEFIDWLHFPTKEQLKVRIEGETPVMTKAKEIFGERVL